MSLEEFSNEKFVIVVSLIFESNILPVSKNKRFTGIKVRIIGTFLAH